MDIGGVIAALCALSFVCLGSLGLLAFVVLRIAGRSLGSVIGSVTGSVSETENFRASSASQSARKFKPKRDQGGFDEAVQRYAGNRDAPDAGQFNAQSARNIPPSSPLSGRDEGGLGGIDPDLQSLRGRSAGSKKRRDSYEIYDDDEGDAGGFMDLLG